MSKRPLNILYISEIQPGPETGGGRVIQQHLDRFSTGTVTVFPPALLQSFWEGSILWRILNRMKRTRFRKLAIAGNYILLTSYLPHAIRLYCEANKPDMVLTVAHGPTAYTACNVAKALRKPLVSFFHDWWPHIAYRNDYYPSFLKIKINRDFQKLYSKATLNLCVSNGMKIALGTHANSKILNPIPNLITEDSGIKPKNLPDKPYILYAGDMGHGYGKMLRALFHEWLKTDRRLDLKFYGNYTDWNDEEIETAKKYDVLHNTVPFTECFNLMQHAELLLTVSSFEEDIRPYTLTSFPSKIASYLQSKSPVASWGPVYSVTHQFFSLYNLPTITTRKASVALQEILKIANETSFTKGSVERAKQDLNPNRIQAEFENLVSQAIMK